MKSKQMIEESLSFCPVCYERVKLYAEPAFSIYIRICAYYAVGEKLLIKMDAKGHGDLVVRFLEQKGFVTTTEFEEDHLQVKPVGHELKQDIHYFCCGKEGCL